MKVKVCVLTAALLSCLAPIGLSCTEKAAPPATQPATQPASRPAAGPAGAPVATTRPALDIANLKITGPHTHENLTLFFIHGEDRIAGEKFLTLQEALAAKKIIIHETGDVNELSVENVGDLPVYIQSGDVIKGGKQDRMLPYDFVVAPRSGRKPISSFCVEQGRWNRRGGESVAAFSANSYVASPKIVLAGKLANDQSEVWSRVEWSQSALSSNVGASVNNGASASSLQLSLESGKLNEKAGPYRQKLAKVLDGQSDAVGFDACVNGQVTDVHIYASRALLVKLWPKLLDTGVFEAIASLDKAKAGKGAAALAPEDVRKFMTVLEAARVREKQVSEDMLLRIRETDKGASFYSVDDLHREIHRSYTSKGD